MPYLFNRTARFAPGNIVESMAWAARMTEKVNTAGDLQFTLWTRVFSSQVGTMSWSTVVENVADLETNNVKLEADGGYLELADEGAKYGDGKGIDDALVHLIVGDPAPEAGFAVLTTAVIAAGQGPTAIPLGIEMAERVKAVTGHPTSFGASVTGRFGEVGWISLAESVDQVQQAGEALVADEAWNALLAEKASTAFAAGSAERWITRKLM